MIRIRMSTRRSAPPLLSLREKRTRINIYEDDDDIYSTRASDVSARFKQLHGPLSALAQDLTNPEQHAKLLLLLLDDTIIHSLHTDVTLDWIEGLLDEARESLIGDTETKENEQESSSNSEWGVGGEKETWKTEEV